MLRRPVKLAEPPLRASIAPLPQSVYIVSSAERVPSYSPSRGWQFDDGRAADPIALEQFEDVPPTDGPDSVLMLKLGARATFGDYLALLAALNSLGICDYFLLEDGVAGEVPLRGLEGTGGAGQWRVCRSHPDSRRIPAPPVL